MEGVLRAMSGTIRVRHRLYGQLCVLMSIALVFIYAGLPAAVQSVEAFTARNLAYGSVGSDVYELQHRLHYLGYYWGKIDGKFGWDTFWAVRTFQYNFGMKVTGFVDMATKMKLVQATKNWHNNPGSNSTNTNHGNPSAQAGTAPSNSATGASAAAMASAPPVVNGITQSDMQLMAHVVYGEARGEPFRGQVAIAAVILNRLRDPRFPHSIPAIIYHPGAFTCVQDGQMNLQPNAEAMKAVLDAVHGWDPALGAVYYFNPATATNPWIWSRPQIITIGHHIFCR